jgi:transposase
VSNGPVLVEVNMHVGKIDMDMNASLLLDTFIATLKWAETGDVFCGKKIVLVLDNAPAHERTEDLLAERLLESNPPLPVHRLTTLRLAPYSAMCNPIAGCFSVLKAAVKRYIAQNIERFRFLRRGETHEGRKQQLVKEAAQRRPRDDHAYTGREPGDPCSKMVGESPQHGGYVLGRVI